MSVAVQIALTATPLAAYFYILGLFHSGGRPRLVSGPADVGLGAERGALTGPAFGAGGGGKLRPVLLLTGPVGSVPEVLVAYISSVVPQPLLTSDIVLFRHTAPPFADEECAQLGARGIRVVEGRVAALEVDDDRLTGVRLEDGTRVARQARLTPRNSFCRG